MNGQLVRFTFMCQVGYKGPSVSCEIVAMVALSA